jgi:hypothetical protein
MSPVKVAYLQKQSIRRIQLLLVKFLHSKQGLNGISILAVFRFFITTGYSSRLDPCNGFFSRPGFYSTNSSACPEPDEKFIFKPSDLIQHKTFILKTMK